MTHAIDPWSAARPGKRIARHLGPAGLLAAVLFLVVPSTAVPQVLNKGFEGRAGEVVSVGLGFWVPAAILVLVIIIDLAVLTEGNSTGSMPWDGRAGRC